MSHGGTTTDFMKTPKTPKRATAQAVALQQPCSATGAKDLALANWMQDVTSLLCYQPEVPHAHKVSLVEALDLYTKRCAEADASKSPNTGTERRDGPPPTNDNNQTVNGPSRSLQ